MSDKELTLAFRNSLLEAMMKMKLDTKGFAREYRVGTTIIRRWIRDPNNPNHRFED